MPSIINATTTNGLVTSADNSGSLQLQTNNGTTALTIDTSQRAAFVAGTAALPAITTSGDTNTGMFFPAADTIAFSEGGVESARFDSSGNLGVGTSSPSTRLDVASPDSSNYDITVSGGRSAGYTGSILFKNSYWSSGAFGAAAIRGLDSGSAGGLLAFYTTTNGGGTTGSPTERMRITSGGDALIGATSSVFGRERLHVYKNGGEGISIINDNNNFGSIFVRGLNSGTCTVLLIRNSADSTVGSITHNGTNTTYGTSSDYRLKENVAPMTGALEKVAQLKPVTYTWKFDGSEGQGFIAHELQEVIPDAVVGEKDAVEEDGSIKSQQIDTSFLVATLTAAIQEQQAQIEELKAEVQALKGVA